MMCSNAQERPITQRVWIMCTNLCRPCQVLSSLVERWRATTVLGMRGWPKEAEVWCACTLMVVQHADTWEGTVHTTSPPARRGATHAPDPRQRRPIRCAYHPASECQPSTAGECAGVHPWGLHQGSGMRIIAP